MIYAYATTLQRRSGQEIITSGTLGYGEASSEDEARGVAVREALNLKPTFQIMAVQVIEVVGVVSSTPDRQSLTKGEKA